MRTRIRKAQVRFEVRHNHLVRTVTGADGRSYAQRCSLDTYTAVADAMQSTNADGSTIASLIAALELPFSQVNVALEFLKERGCVEVYFRRSYPASNCVFEDALLEFYALKQQPQQ